MSKKPDRFKNDIRHILIEGENGEEIIKPFPERKGRGLPGEKKKKFMQEQAEFKDDRQGTNRVTAREPGKYTWSMGYNNCVGRYSPGGKYGKFSGSSLNRNKKIKSEKHVKDVQSITNDLVAVARKTGRKLSERYGGIPWPLLTLIARADDESKGEYRDWLSQQMGGDVFGLSYRVHMLSTRSRGKIKDKATAFFRSCPGSRVFATLTFVAAVDDRTGITILNKFLTSLRKKFSNIQYFWVAERQTKNPDTPNNIHFHMILNKRLPVNVFNSLWVLQQYNAGLVGKDKYGNVITKADIQARYKAGTVGKVLNPLDVKKIGGDVYKLSSYLTKYITKQKKDEPFGCAVWHCSRRVSRLFTRAVVGPSAFAYLKSFSNYRVDKKTGECWPAVEQKGPYHVIIYVNDKKAPLRYLKEMEQINKWIMEGLEITMLPEIDDDYYTKEFISEGGSHVK